MDVRICPTRFGRCHCTLILHNTLCCVAVLMRPMCICVYHLGLWCATFHKSDMLHMGRNGELSTLKYWVIALSFVLLYTAKRVPCPKGPNAIFWQSTTITRNDCCCCIGLESIAHWICKLNCQCSLELIGAISGKFTVWWYTEFFAMSGCVWCFVRVSRCSHGFSSVYAHAPPTPLFHSCLDAIPPMQIYHYEGCKQFATIVL